MIRASLILLLMAPLACAFQAGPINIAIGDSEASRCFDVTEVDADGAYTCEGGAQLARGSAISEGIVALFTALVDFARSLVAGLGAALASVGEEDSSRDT